jgi:hypothetical protein
MDSELTFLEKALIEQNPRPALGMTVLWRGYLCTVLPTPREASPLLVMVERSDGWRDYASTVGLKIQT